MQMHYLFHIGIGESLLDKWPVALCYGINKRKHKMLKRVSVIITGEDPSL